LALDDLFSSIRFWGYQADRWSAWFKVWL
jgi:hypothetical protein